MEVYPTYATHPNKQMIIAYLMILPDVQPFGKKILCNFCQGCEIEIIKRIKGNVSRQVRRLYDEFKEYREKELWADSYYCGTAGHVSQEQVIRYIAEQDKQVKSIQPFSYSIFDKEQTTLAEFTS